jgi:predicted aspartyl protease
MDASAIDHAVKAAVGGLFLELATAKAVIEAQRKEIEVLKSAVPIPGRDDGHE